MSQFVSLAAQSSAILLMIGVAWYDVKHFKIRNSAVLVFLLLYFPAAGFQGFQDWRGDLIAGGILFTIGFVMWLLRGLGAGDVKLMFPLGMHLGYDGLLPFAILLMVLSVLLYLGIVLSAFFGVTRGGAGWMARMKETGKVPYGVLLAMASGPVLLLRLQLSA